MPEGSAAHWTADRGLSLSGLEPTYLEVTVWPDGEVLLRGDEGSVDQFLNLADRAGSPIELRFRSPCG